MSINKKKKKGKKSSGSWIGSYKTENFRCYSVKGHAIK